MRIPANFSLRAGPFRRIRVNFTSGSFTGLRSISVGPERVVWCYEEDDESIEELGELFRNSVKLTFEMRAIEVDDDEYED